MNVRKHLLEAVTLIAAAVICAVVANVMASRERKLVLVGNYPNAQKVPVRSAEPLTPVTTTIATATVAPIPMPVTATVTPVVTATTTTAPPKPAAIKPPPVAAQPAAAAPA
ncbi:MAG: hypothetical protein JWO97_979, partial [Acidobacteria bacterium]|nr:hypothetical protein [Acidobacteriota bacterium]